MPTPGGDTLSQITAELGRFVKAGRQEWRTADLDITWLRALPAVQKQIAALELEADPSSNDLMDAIEAAIKSALDELHYPVSSAGLDYFGFSDSGRRPLGKTEREEQAADRFGSKSGRWFRDRNSKPPYEGQSPASWIVGEVAKRLLAEDRPKRPDGGRAGYFAKPTASGVAKCIVRDLESLYKPDRLDRLAWMIVSDAPVYDALVTLTLCDNEDDANSYLLTQFIEGVCRRSTYYLAISARATLTDLIKSTCDQVSGFFTCSEQDHVMERAKAWEHDEGALTLSSSDEKELGKEDSLCLHLVDDDAERNEVLAGISQDCRQDVALLRADFPRAATDRPSRVRLQLTSSMARSDHYCSWVAERPTFLTTMTFDASGMKLDKDERFTLQPCFRGPATEPKKPRKNVYQIFVNGWIVRGQGALLVWG